MTKQHHNKNSISFVIAVNDEKVFQANVLASPILKSGYNHEILARRGFPSAGAAYNDAISSASNDLIVFLHQDIYLPDDWDQKLQSVIESVEKSENKWGVLGCFGVSLLGTQVGHVYSNGLKKELGFSQLPVRVQSLDEIVLVIRKSSGLRFDPMFPHFHLYGTDICLESKKRGFKNYAISNYCLHNSLPVYKLPKEFWQCANYLRIKWRRDLPIKTCCTTISTSSIIMRLKRILSWNAPHKRFLGKQEYDRLPDPSVSSFTKRAPTIGRRCWKPEG